MTDRIHALTVVLDEDMRIDDAEPLVQAIRMMRHVADVQPISVTESDLWDEIMGFKLTKG